MKKFLIFLGLISAVATSQYFFDRVHVKHPEVPPMLLPVQAVKSSDLGLHSAASGLMWVQTIQNILAPGNKNKFLLPEYINSVNDLDPKFSYPYAFGTLVLPDLKLVDEAVEMGERGIKNAGSDWRIAYYLATTYHIFKHDRVMATKYFDMVARNPDAPDEAKRVAINYGTAPDVRSQTKQIWIGAYETSGDEIIRERARLYILHYEYIELLEKAAGIYKQKFGKYPSNLSQLVSQHILKAIPEDPFGLEYVVDARGRVTVKTVIN